MTSLTQAGNVLSPLTDHLGTTRDLADRNESTGVTTVTNHRRFDSYGAIISETATTVDLVFGFTGRPFDESTGQQNNGNRWYVLGVWLSEDPIGFLAGDPNLRRYVGNSPTDRSDPDGLVWRNVDDWLHWANTDVWGTIYHLPSAYFETAWDGQQAQSLAAFADGWVPFVDPLESAGAYNRCEGVNNASWWVGNITRDAQIFVVMMRSGNLGAWARRPILYELGSTTVAPRIWVILQNMSVVERGRWLMATYGWAGFFQGGGALGQFWTTLRLGGTPGGWLLLLGAINGTQYGMGQYDACP